MMESSRDFMITGASATDSDRDLRGRTGAGMIVDVFQREGTTNTIQISQHCS